MALIRDEKITNLSILEDLIQYDQDNWEAILTDIYNTLMYDFESYKSDFEFVEIFLQVGDDEQVQDYLNFVPYILNKNIEESDKYWYLFSSAKLFCNYGSIIKNYPDEHKFLLSDLYSFTEMSRIAVSEVILSDSDFFLREMIVYHHSYEEMVQILYTRKKNEEWAYDALMPLEGKVFH